MFRHFVFIVGGTSCLVVGVLFGITQTLPSRPVTPVTPTDIGVQSLVGPSFSDFHRHLMIASDSSGTLLVAGDIMLGRDVASLITEHGPSYPFEKASDTIQSATCAVANLEGPITDLDASPANPMVFHFDPALTAQIATAGFDAVSMANNHARNEGAQGVADTQKNLTDAGIGFGDAGADDGPTWTCVAGGKRIVILGLHDVYRKVDLIAATKAIGDARMSADMVIPFMHWGDEYRHDHSAHQSELAHALIDAGADMVIGAHPHVVEGIELYKGKPIFYSLGNFIFDQYFSRDTQEGLALRFNFGSATSVDLLPLAIPKSQPTFVDGTEKARMLNDLAGWSDAGLKDQILDGRLEIK